MATFTKQVQDVHRLLAPRVPIEHFVEALNPKALGLEDRSQFFAPIAFGVQISGPIGGAAGGIRVEVPVHANPKGWLPLMKSRFARMIGMPKLRAEEMEFRTITGAPLQSIPVESLNRVGKLNLFVQGELLRMPEVPPIPIEYSTNKMADIATWITERVEQALPDVLASTLQKHCQSAASLEKALLPDALATSTVPTRSPLRKHSRVPNSLPVIRWSICALSLRAQRLKSRMRLALKKPVVWQPKCSARTRTVEMPICMHHCWEIQ